MITQNSILIIPWVIMYQNLIKEMLSLLYCNGYKTVAASQVSSCNRTQGEHIEHISINSRLLITTNEVYIQLSQTVPIYAHQDLKFAVNSCTQHVADTDLPITQLCNMSSISLTNGRHTRVAVGLPGMSCGDLITPSMQTGTSLCMVSATGAWDCATDNCHLTLASRSCRFM